MSEIGTAARHFRDDTGVQWGASVRDGSGRELLSLSGADALSIGSVGKLLLLIEAARLLVNGDLDRSESLVRRTDDEVAGSGLWQHLEIGALPAVDVAVLTAAFSDNLATNVLLRRVGLAAIERLARDLDLSQTTIHDQIREPREPHHARVFAEGAASELSAIMNRAGRGAIVSGEVSRTVLYWLSLNADLSMVTGAWGFDPLEHSLGNQGISLSNKTGTDVGVRADVGHAAFGERSVSYAVIANWDESAVDARDAVLIAMKRFGVELRSWLTTS
jgi:beta-lactamase class A